MLLHLTTVSYMDIEKQLTAKEACEALGIVPVTLWRWVKSGFIKQSRFGPRGVRYAQSEIDRINAGVRSEGSK